ncbi:hypothetical protein ACF1FX_27070 [Streptomyces sp. NPDC014646]|uniref:hypothetical protein n=1 Tax=unclassified Streptomyces TaxID=2593676 RepID=UPI0036F8B2AF
MGETGIPAVDAAVVWAVAAAAIAGGAGLLWRFVRGARRLAAKLDDFVDDWHGVAGRPGVPERPGVMARLARIEQQGDEHAAHLVRIDHELHPNSGQSLRDAVDRVDARTQRLTADRPDD